MSEVRRSVAFVILGLLCGQFLVLGLIQADRDSVTVDEAVDITAGLVAVADRDLRMNPEHGLVHHVVSAVLPVLISDPIIPDSEAYDDGDWFDYTDDLISANDEAGRLDGVVFWSRVVPLLLGAASGAVIYALGTRIVGRSGGVFAACLWLTTPYVVGLSHLTSLDITFTFAVLLLALAVDRLREAPTRARLIVVAVALGLALATRHTAVVLVPVVLGMVVVLDRSRERRDRAVRVALVLLVPVALVWIGYRAVDPTPVDGPPRERFDGLIAAAESDGPLPAVVLAVPMPVEWRAGLAYLVETSEPRPAYLLGSSWTGSRWWYFPVSAAVKVPVGAIVAVVLGVWAVAARGGRQAWQMVIATAPLGGALSLFLLLQPLDLGLRLAVPVLALAFVAAGGVAHVRRPLAVSIVALVASGQVVAMTAAHPDALSWTQPPLSDGYRWVTDSNIDIGQANEVVRERHRSSTFVAASLTAPRGFEVLPGVPRVEDVDAEELVGDVVVSATELTVTHREELSWLRAYCPVEVIESSVVRYRFVEPVDRSPGPVTPASPCRGEVSRRP